VAGVVVVCAAASGCNSTSSGEGAGKTIANLIFYGGTTVPPTGAGLPATVPCPPVSVAPGGGAINSYAGGREGGPEALRSQISITNVARECTGRPDGSVVVKVGVEGRALIGPSGSGGRFDTPVRFAIKRGERVLASATRRAAVSLSSSEPQGTFLVIEEGLVVPANTDDFDIEVALGGLGAAQRPARGARR
jgi:hypothetical protein